MCGVFLSVWYPKWVAPLRLPLEAELDTQKYCARRILGLGHGLDELLETV